MNIRKINEYRFYTTAELDNPTHDRRHRHGIEAIAGFATGTQVRVEVNGVFDDDGNQIGDTMKLYQIAGRRVRGLDDALAAMDPGRDDPARSLKDLAERNFTTEEWFAYAALEKLVASGAVTLDQVQSAWDETEEVSM